MSTDNLDGMVSNGMPGPTHDGPEEVRVAPPFEKAGYLMYLRALDAFEGGGVLTIGWRLTGKGDDPWTARFNAFKNHDARAIRAAKATVGRAMGGVTFKGAPPSLVVGAISSSKEKLDPEDPVWQLGAAVAEAVRAPWRPDVLHKQAHRSLHNLTGGWGARAAEVNGKYSCKPIGSPTTVLVVDDFFTRGNTLADIARALTQAAKVPPLVYGFGLGKTERVSWPPNAGISNDHVPAELAQIWDAVK